MPEGKAAVISKRYTQRIERHNLNLRQPGTADGIVLKTVELHDKVIGII
jgi:insertion element IS1 protein InsB